MPKRTGKKPGRKDVNQMGRAVMDRIEQIAQEKRRLDGAHLLRSSGRVLSSWTAPSGRGRSTGRKRKAA